MDAKSTGSFKGFTANAMKVNKVRQAQGRKTRDIRLISSAGLFGLLAISSPYAAIAGGVLIGTWEWELCHAEMNIMKSQAIKHKLKRVARKVSEKCGVNMHFTCNFNTRQAGFVLYDPSGKFPISSFLTSENIKDCLTQEQCQIFITTLDESLAKMNSYRGKGEEARNSKESMYKDYPKINLDNITCAFDEVGGVLTNKELISLSGGTKLSYLEYKKFMKEHKNEELWVFASRLFDYLNSLSEMNINEKGQILMEFEYHFKKMGAEGEREYSNLWNQLRQEDELKRAM